MQTGRIEIAKLRFGIMAAFGLWYAAAVGVGCGSNNNGQAPSGGTIQSTTGGGAGNAAAGSAGNGAAGSAGNGAAEARATVRVVPARLPQRAAPQKAGRVGAPRAPRAPQAVRQLAGPAQLVGPVQLVA